METFKNILVPFDFREQAEIALTQSYNLSRLTGLHITLLYVHEESGFLNKFFSADQSDELVRKMEAELDIFVKGKSKETGLEINFMVARGKVHSKIVEVAEMIQAKFIVMGTASSTIPEENSIGANTSRVIRNAKCPVLTVGSAGYYNGCRSILLPLDLTKETRQKVGWAIEIAKMFGATIKVITVLWSTNHKEIAGTLRAQIAQVNDFIEARHVQCSTEIIEANKESEETSLLLKYAKDQGDIDLIMIMTQQETGLIPFFIDKQATEIIRLSSIPVMSIIPKDTGDTLAR
ncbi:MAG: universal stress protein [Bacteroidota bacterium]